MLRNCKKCNTLFDGRGCVACKNARNAANYTQNKDIINAKHAAYRNNHKGQIKEYAAAWYAKNHDAINVKGAIYRSNNLDKRRVYANNYRAMKKSSGRLSQGLAAKLYELQKGKCVCCSKRLSKDYHLDHIVPLALGGKNIDSNIQLLRSTCNLVKGATPPEQFMRQRGFLL